MKLVVIDGQGGGFGKAIIEALRAKGYAGDILAVGTNALATSAMLKAGASAGATGENAAAVNAARADIVAGPLGLVMANSMLGECTPAMAAANCAEPRRQSAGARCQMQRAGGRLCPEAAGRVNRRCRPEGALPVGAGRLTRRPPAARVERPAARRPDRRKERAAL